MIVYLDNCAFNRPFDDQNQNRIKIETESVHLIREHINAGELNLVWSYLNDFEASRNPFPEIREAAYEWRQMATIFIGPALSILETSYKLRRAGIKPVDSLHIAAAHKANSKYFISTDDGILSKVKVFGDLHILNPVAFLSTWRIYDERCRN